MLSLAFFPWFQVCHITHPMVNDSFPSSLPSFLPSFHPSLLPFLSSSPRRQISDTRRHDRHREMQRKRIHRKDLMVKRELEFGWLGSGRLVCCVVYVMKEKENWNWESMGMEKGKGKANDGLYILTTVRVEARRISCLFLRFSFCYLGVRCFVFGLFYAVLSWLALV